jgi:hypothetical protein
VKRAIFAVLIMVAAGQSVPGPDALHAVRSIGTDSLEHDVGVEALLMPDMVDTGKVVVPEAVVANYGQWSESFPAWFELPSGFLEMLDVADLEVGMRETLSFPAWRATRRGWNTFSAWTLLSGDEQPANDSASDSLFVRVKDVGITDVDVPDTIWPDTFRIRVELTNFGNVPLVFPLLLRLNLVSDTVDVESLMPGESRWVCSDTLRLPPGVWLVNISVRLAGDAHPENNDTSFVLIVRGVIHDDVACEQILVPHAVIDTGAFTPRARYANYGTSEVTCTTFCWIEDTATDVVVYQDRASVMLPAETCSVVTYDQCTLKVVGPYMVSCSIHLAIDQNWLNNAIHQPFRVGAGAEYDVMVSAILAPPGLVDSGVAVVPQAEVFNAGLYTETFPVWFRLPDYEDMKEIALGAGLYDTVSFNIWLADFPPGSRTAVAFTLLEGDLNTANDTLVKPFTIQKRDVHVSAIYSPEDTVNMDTLCEPAVEVTNYGNTVETFAVHLDIYDTLLSRFYTEMESVIGLVGGNSETVVFPAVRFTMPGWHVLRCSLSVCPSGSVVKRFLVTQCPGVGELKSKQVLEFACRASSPCCAQMTVRYSLPRAELVDLAVYSGDGRRVRTLASGRHEAGRYLLVWDGRDDSGRHLAPGVYLVRLSARGQFSGCRVAKVR